MSMSHLNGFWLVVLTPLWHTVLKGNRFPEVMAGISIRAGISISKHSMGSLRKTSPCGRMNSWRPLMALYCLGGKLQSG